MYTILSVRDEPEEALTELVLVVQATRIELPLKLYICLAVIDRFTCKRHIYSLLRTSTYARCRFKIHFGLWN